MKTQNTLENKAAFFAQYWGQEVCVYPPNGLAGKFGGINIVSWMISSVDISDFYLQLTPLSQISDEDVMEVAKIFNIGHLKGSTVPLIKGILQALDGNTPKSETTEFVLHWLHAQDFLRSKGYAVPWRDLSVEDLVSYGWVKLKTEQK